MDYRLKGGDCREVEGEGHLSSKRKKECRAADPSRGKGRDLGKTEAQVWVIGLSEQTCQCTGCKVLLFPRLSRGAGVCVCVYM